MGNFVNECIGPVSGGMVASSTKGGLGCLPSGKGVWKAKCCHEKYPFFQGWVFTDGFSRMARMGDDSKERRTLMRSST
jgi:hypothetical protein